MTQPVPESTGTAVAKTDRASAKFLEAFQKGGIDRQPPDVQANFLMALAPRLGVKAEIGELMLYQGKPYITLAGYRRIAQSTGLLDGITTRPATNGERRGFGAKDGDHLWVCDVYRKGARGAFRGWGYVTAGDRNPVTKTHPQGMAKKRATYDALRTAFPPGETITDLHIKFAEEAEAEAERLSRRAPAVMASDYGDAPDFELETSDVGAEDETSGAEPDVGPQQADAAESPAAYQPDYKGGAVPKPGKKSDALPALPLDDERPRRDTRIRD